MMHDKNTIYGTTIIAVKLNNETVIAGDGQVTLGSQVIKSSAKKVRKIANGSVIVGFAGATADAFALLERLEQKLEKYPSQLMRACVEMAKDWRTDRYLRKLEAMMLVANKETVLLMSGNGDVIEPEDNIIAIGSGGGFALAAAHGFLKANNKTDSKTVALEALKIAASMCIYTNDNIVLESV